jgi:hypothetical protein
VNFAIIALANSPKTISCRFATDFKHVLRVSLEKPLELSNSFYSLLLGDTLADVVAGRGTLDNPLLNFSFKQNHLHHFITLQIEIEQSIVGSLFNGDGLTELEFCNLREEVTLMNGGAYSL